MKLFEISRKERMIEGFVNINECKQFEDNLYNFFKKGKIEKKTYDYLANINEKKRGSLHYEKYLDKTGDYKIDQSLKFSKNVYEDFMLCLETYEKLVCINGNASRIRRKMKEKGIGKTLVDMVSSKNKKDAFLKLETKGLLKYSMEALVIRNSHEFSNEIILVCEAKLGNNIF